MFNAKQSNPFKIRKLIRIKKCKLQIKQLNLRKPEVFFSRETELALKELYRLRLENLVKTNVSKNKL